MKTRKQKKTFKKKVHQWAKKKDYSSKKLTGYAQ